MDDYAESSVPRQSGKTVLVTGANTGIGFEAARVLAERGARVLLGCRSEQRAQDAIRLILDHRPEADLDWVPLDLADLKSVEAAALRVGSEERLDVLINNAGVMVPKKTRTEDGFEMQFGVNHLGHFALTGRLLDLLTATAGARVVHVSSLAHHSGRIDFDDPHATRSHNALRRYAVSKAANLYFMFELARRCEARGLDVTNVGCHPGVANTDLPRTFPAWLSVFVPLIALFFNSSAEGALPTLLAATAPDARPTDYFGPTRRGERAKSAGMAVVAEHIRDQAVARRLWDLSAEWTGVSYLES